MEEIELKWTSEKVEAKTHPLNLKGPKFTFPKLWILEAIIRAIFRKPVPKIPYTFSIGEAEVLYSKEVCEQVFGKTPWYKELIMTVVMHIKRPFYWINHKIDAWKMSYTNMRCLP